MALKVKTKPITIRISEETEKELSSIVNTIQEEIKYTGAEVTIASVTRRAVEKYVKDFKEEQEGASTIVVNPKKLENLDFETLEKLSKELLNCATYINSRLNDLKGFDLTGDKVEILDGISEVYSTIQGTVNEAYVKSFMKQNNITLKDK